MRENEFERKVQEQMEELRIRPSDETWERVEKELREISVDELTPLDALNLLAKLQKKIS